MDAAGRKVISKNSVDWLQFLLNPRLVAVLLSSLIAAIYLPSISHPFVFDDIPELVQNIDVQSPLGCWNTIVASQNTGLSGRPFACLTFAANIAIDGYRVRGFHFVNILIHLFAALILFAIVRRTIARTCENAAPAVPAAGLIALIWALHPLQTESVTYIIQRIESLAGLMYLLTLYCAIRSWEPQHSFLWRSLSIGCCVLGMLTKEIVATAPLLVFFYDVIFVARSWTGVLRQRKTLYAALACTWAIPAILLYQSPRSGTVGFGLGVSALDYLRTQSEVLLHYLRLCFWPHPQSISYSDWTILRRWGPAIAPGIVILLLLCVSIAGTWRRKWWGYCGLWFFLILAPSSSFVPIVTEPAAERRMYLPLAGVITIAVFGLAGLFRSIGTIRPLEPRIANALAVGLGLAVVGALGAITIVRNAQYSAATTILSSDLAVRPGDELIRGALIEELVHEQRQSEASQIHEEGIALNPNSYILYDNWARTMNTLGRHEEAFQSFSRAIEIRPDYHPARAGMGVTLIEMGRYVDALSQLQQAARLAPNSFTIRGNMAVAFSSLGRTEEAITELQVAIALKPGFADGHYNLARLLMDQKKWNEAVEHFRVAAALRPDDAEFQRAYAQALQQDTRTNKGGKP